MRTAKTLIRLGGSPGCESLLGAHSFCWFCHVTAQMKDIRVLNGCELRFKNSVMRLTIQYHWACQFSK